MKSKIEWTDRVWNPITGCTKISEGCQNCYAERMAKRLAGRCGYDEDDPFRVTIHRDRLRQPYTWVKPARVFVCSMGDLFHKDIPMASIYEIWRIMGSNKKHTFIVLTKRPERMRSLIAGHETHIWLGVTCENQRTADERIPILLGIQSAVSFVSCEPMLGPIHLGGYRPDWVICGGESGPKRRPFNPDWARDLRDQCKQASVPFFMKQIDKQTPIPDDLMIREYPE